MSKANQKFVQADEAVSPVIGVILMVAITVVLAAVVFVLVSNLSKTSDKAEDAAFRSTSPIAGEIHVLMITQGANAPYDVNTEDTLTADDVFVSIDGQICNAGPAAAVVLATTEFDNLPGGDAQWGAGETIVFDTDCTGTSAAPSAVVLASATEHTVTVTVRGAVIFTGNVVIR